MRTLQWSAPLLALLLLAVDVFGRGHRTENFIVTAPTQQLAIEIGEAAERYRYELAIEWLGQPLRRWPQPCPISVQEGPQMGAGGATSFMFEGRQPFGWRMSIQGSRERLLDSVLPHEVTHTIFATHFGRPLPRWADEGACTTVEHPSERARQDQFLIQFMKSSPPRSIAFNQMFRMTEYPHDILPLYAQGHSVARYLIQQGGKRKFVDYVGRGMDTNNWDGATQEFYGYQDLSELQLDWVSWVQQASPEVGTEQLAAMGLGPQRPSRYDAFAAAVPGQATAAVASLERLQPIPQTAANPASRVAASQPVGPQRGWYERRRDEARNGLPEPTQMASAAPVSSQSIQPAEHLQWLPGSARMASRDLVSRAMARPQGPQQPAQMVLQWDPPREQLAQPAIQMRRSVKAEPVIHMDAPIDSTVRR